MKRLLDGAGNDVERGLLDALRLERPSPELEQRMRDALGLGPVAAPVPAAPAAPAAKAFGGWGAVAAGTVVAALFVGGGALVRSQMSDEPLPLTPVENLTPSEPAHPAPTPAVAAEPDAPAPFVTEDATPKPRARSTQGGSAAIQNPQSLREEIQLIDAARVAVKKNDKTHAIALLDRYARRFPEGAFREEARVLRAEALKSRPSAP